MNKQEQQRLMHAVAGDDEKRRSIAALLEICESSIDSLEAKLGVDLSNLRTVADDCAHAYTKKHGLSYSDVLVEIKLIRARAAKRQAVRAESNSNLH